MSEKISLWDTLAVFDMNGKAIWKELSDDQKKSVGFWILNRWMSSVKGTREKQELAVMKTNEYYNKNFGDISCSKDGHQELFWQLLCLAGNTGKIESHTWIGHKKKSTNATENKVINFLNDIYPNMKEDEIELLARITSKDDIIKLAEEHGIEGFKLK